MKTKNDGAGIDYGRGMANIDTETGIRYGVISQNEVLEAWADSSEPDFMECREDEESDCLEALSYSLDDGEYKACCGEDGDIFIIKSPFYTYCRFCSPCAPGAGYLMNWFKAKYTTNLNGQEYTGVIDWENYPIEYTERAKRSGYIKAYCFGHDWFDNDVAPYPVYRVDNDELVKGEE